MFRRQSARDCECALGRWVVTVHRAARRDASGSRCERSLGPLVPVTPGRAVPAKNAIYSVIPPWLRSRRREIPAGAARLEITTIWVCPQSLRPLPFSESSCCRPLATFASRAFEPRKRKPGLPKTARN